MSRFRRMISSPAGARRCLDPDPRPRRPTPSQPSLGIALTRSAQEACAPEQPLRVGERIDDHAARRVGREALVLKLRSDFVADLESLGAWRAKAHTQLSTSRPAGGSGNELKQPRGHASSGR